MKKKLFVMSSAIMMMAVVAAYGASNTRSDFAVKNGKLKKAAAPFAWKLTADQNKTAVAIKKLDKPITSSVTFEVKLQTAQKKGPYNGFLMLRTNGGKVIRAGVLIGAKGYKIWGNAIKKPVFRSDRKTKQQGVFDLAVHVDLAKHTIQLKDGGKAVLTGKLKKDVSKISAVGYLVNKTSTDFSKIKTKK